MHKAIAASLVIVAVNCAFRAAIAQTLDKNEIWQSNKHAVVQLRAFGTAADGSPKKIDAGTGVVISPDGYILTAEHVVGADSVWFLQPGSKRDRHVQVTILDDQDSSHVVADDTTSVVTIPGYDLALIRINRAKMKYVRLAKSRPRDLSQYVALVWASDGGIPQPRSGGLTVTDVNKDGDLLTFEMPVVEGFSGSPVFDSTGQAIGILVRQKGPALALAQSVADVKDRLTMIPTNVGPSESDLAVCEGKERTLRAQTRTFKESNGVHCEPNGDTQRRDVEFSAPPNFSIIGFVSHDDETNEYGRVGSLEYVPPGPDGKITKVKIHVECSTPPRSFGSTGWARTTLHGSIQRTLTPSDLLDIRNSCASSLSSR